MAGTGDHVELLFSGQIDKFNGISGNADGELAYSGFPGVPSRLSVFDSKDIYILNDARPDQNIRPGREPGYFSVLSQVTERPRCNRFCVGDAVERIFIWKLCDRV